MSKKSRGSGSCCSVASCKNTGRMKLSERPELKFHRFPKDPDLRREWIRKCGRKERFNADSGTVCSDHFMPYDYKRNLRAELLGEKKDKKQLLPDVVPHRNLPPEIQRRIRRQRDKDLTETEQIARRKKLVEDAIKWAESLSSTPAPSEEAGKNLPENASSKNQTANVEIDASTEAVSIMPEPVNCDEISLPKQNSQETVINVLNIRSPDNLIIENWSEENSPEHVTEDEKTDREKYLELLSKYTELDVKYKRCYKVLCCFKIAHTKLKSQNSAAKAKIIELRNRNKFLQRQRKNFKKSQKHRSVQTEFLDSENDVTGWW